MHVYVLDELIWKPLYPYKWFILTYFTEEAKIWDYDM